MAFSRSSYFPRTSVNSFRSRYSSTPVFEPETKRPPPEKTIPVKPKASSSEEETSSEESEGSSSEESSSEEEAPSKNTADQSLIKKSSSTEVGSGSKEEGDTKPTPPAQTNGAAASSSSSDEESSDEDESSEEESSGAERRREAVPARRRPGTAAEMASSGADSVPWRRPKLRRVERKSSGVRQSSTELPEWAEDAKKRLGDMPLPPPKQQDATESSRPDWAERKVDVDRLEELERKRSQEKPTPSTQPEWSGRRLAAAALGRLERHNRLDKMASFDRAPPQWADRSASIERRPLTESQQERLERLKKTPRRRPDWNEMMREITCPERQLKRVECRDRSAPIIHDLRRRGQEFVFESEKRKESAAAKLMNDIRSGVKLKKVRCNDRSRPNLQGLRKLRRQRTSEAFLNLPPEELMDSEPEDQDDIDRVRDDLQSVRQLLGEEVKHRERLAKENKHLKNELKRAQEELQQKPRVSVTLPPKPERSEDVTDGLDDDLGALEGEMAAIRDQAGQSSREAQQWQERCLTAEQELAALRARLEELEAGKKSRKVSMENGGADGELRRNRSSAKVARSRTKDKLAKTASQARISRDESGWKPAAPREEAESSAEESDEELDSDDERRREVDQERRKTLRELKMCQSKVSHLQTKEKHAKDERMNLKNRIRTLNMNMKDENRKYKELQREVKKMGAMLKDSDDEDEEEEEEESEEESSEEESITETESESEESESDESESIDEELPIEERLRATQERVKRHEESEKAIKKGNYMLKTTAERMFDELRNEREKYRMLERQLNDLVNELG